ncbi:MAG: hypothetical protein SFZ03_02635 [Candidatus Melainabacteria bacterium]|nr:hypothetical protein [Candidatus Melainabacteria bacterium]
MSGFKTNANAAFAAHAAVFSVAPNLRPAGSAPLFNNPVFGAQRSHYGQMATGMMADNSNGLQLNLKV